MVVPLRDQCLTFLTKRKYRHSPSSLIWSGGLSAMLGELADSPDIHLLGAR